MSIVSLVTENFPLYSNLLTVLNVPPGEILPPPPELTNIIVVQSESSRTSAQPSYCDIAPESTYCRRLLPPWCHGTRTRVHCTVLGWQVPENTSPCTAVFFVLRFKNSLQKLVPYLREYTPMAVYSKVICLGSAKNGKKYSIYKARPYIRMTGGCTVQYSHIVLYYCAYVLHSLAHLSTSRLTCAILFCSNIRPWLYNRGWPYIRIYSQGLILV